MLYHQTELDKRLGCSWHVVVGEEFGFDVTYEVRDRGRYHEDPQAQIWNEGFDSVNLGKPLKPIQ